MNTKDKFLEDGVTPNPNYIEPKEEKTDAEKAAEAEAKIEARIAESTATSLADIKAKLDAAYATRDAAIKKTAELELKEKDAAKAKLVEEGKYKELYELGLAERDAEIAKAKAETAVLESRNVELSRDVAVREALKGLPFRNDKASEMAYKEIIAQLVRNDKGEWVHKSGVTIKDFTTLYSKDEDQSFLFKPKSSSGSGSSGSTGTANSNDGKSLFGKTQAEVMKMAAEGTLPKRKK